VRAVIGRESKADEGVGHRSILAESYSEAERRLRTLDTMISKSRILL